MPRNIGVDAQVTQLPCAQAQFSAAASLVNAAAQFVPPFNGAVTTLAAGVGHLVQGTPTIVFIANNNAAGDQRIIDSLRLRFTGAANVSAQTISARLYKNGVAAGLPTPAVATTAGVKTASVDFNGSPPSLANLITLDPGDVLTCAITPSAALDVVVTDVMVSAGG